MYVDYDFFKTIYGGSEAEFNKHAFKAQRVLDNQTTGIDGVKKLQEYFPTDAYDVECVKQCMCELINAFIEIDAVNEAQKKAMVATTSGTTSGVIESISSGSETIKYATSGTSEISKIATDERRRTPYINRTVRTYLNGCKDSRGVNLLYMGYV